MLAELDAMRAVKPANPGGEAQLLLRLAATYNAASSQIPIELLRSALDLAIDGTQAASPAVAGTVTACLINDLVSVGRSDEGAALAVATVKRVRQVLSVSEVDSYLGALRKSIGDSSLATQKLSLNPVSAKIEELNRADDGAFRSGLIAVLVNIRSLETTGRPGEATDALKLLSSMVTAREGSSSHLSGLVFAVQAENELVNGSVDQALSLIDLLNRTTGDADWSDQNGSEIEALRDNLQQFAREARSARITLESKKQELMSFESQPNADQDELVNRLNEMISDAAGAHEYKVAMDAFKRLMNLHPNFGDPGLLVRSQPQQLLESMGRSCHDLSIIHLSPAGKTVPIGECANLAVAAAGIVAEDALADLRDEAPEQRLNNRHNFDIGQVISDLEPFLNDDRSISQASLASLLKWAVAAQPTPVSTAVDNELLLAFATSDPGLVPSLQNWHTALSVWLKSEATAECSASATPIPTGLQDLRSNALSDAASVEASWKHLTEHVPDGVPISVNTDLDVANLQRSLGPGEAILVFMVTDHSIAIWLVRDDRIDLRIAPKGGLALDIDRLIPAISNRPKDAADKLTLKPFEQLYDQLIAPIRGHLDGITRLYVNPDVLTARVPFNALVETVPLSGGWSVSMDWTPRWLARRFAISFVPSVSAFAFEHQRPSRPARALLAAGNPRLGAVAKQAPDNPCERILETSDDIPMTSTPGAAEELAGVVALAGSGSELLSQDDFTLPNLLARDRRTAGLLVFATHGLPETATRSARLLLSPGSKGALDASWLAPSDMKALSLDADLVILSACDSGLADGGEGLSSLMPAFLAAGARQVLATAWNVGAETGPWITLPMTRRYLTFGSRTVDLTLQSAILSMISDQDKSVVRHPFYWAGFFLLGSSTN